MFEFIRLPFAKKKPPTTQEDLGPSARVLGGDTAWAEDSMLYSARDFEKYNPDDLIGRKGATIYRKMMMDEQVKAVIKFKRDAITSRDYTFELDYEDYGLSEEEAKRRIAISYKYMSAMKGTWNDALNGILSSMYQGFSLSEKLFKLVEYKKAMYWGVQAIKVKPFNTFTFAVDEYGNILKCVQKMNGHEQEIDLNKFIHFVSNPDVDEHYGQSELREAYRAWFSKDSIIKFRNMWLERHAGGFRYAQLSEKAASIGPNSAEYIALKSVLNSISQSSGVIMPSIASLNTVYPAANVAFKEAIQDQDTAIARALLVPNLLGVSPQGDVGSYSQSTNQLEAFFWTLDADASRLEDAVNEQLFKQLGKLNFGDDAWPRFKFKPVSLAKKLEIINTWKDLVTSGSVKSNANDEQYLRELLEFPDVIEDDGEVANASDPNSAFNGAQVSSMVSIIVQVGTGEIPKDSAIELLIAAFPINRETAKSIIDPIEVKEPVDPVQPANSGDNLNDDEAKNKPTNSENTDTGNRDRGTGGNVDANSSGNAKVDETIVGRSQAKVSAFEKAKKQARNRVAFAVIDKSSESVIEGNVGSIASVMDLVVADLVEKGKAGGSVDKDVSSNIRNLSVDSKLKSKLNRAIYSMLQEGHAIGLRHAQNEIDSARGEDYSRKFNRDRLNAIAEDFFKVNSFKVSGDMTKESIKIVENVILNGARYDWTWEQMEEEIYRTFAKKGMISMEQAREALGDALNVENPDALLRTMVRTNTFDAINTARYDYFTDPGLKGFVQAFEYSAILDDRTTEICRHLDEDNAGNHSTDWYAQHAEFRPPNHYNCRSLLVPVTEVDIDAFEEGPEPEEQPQVGFGG